jgi:hypothetical protein
MRRLASRSGIIIGLVATSLGGLRVGANGETLITREEASRPDVPSSTIRVLLPGPIATPVSPKDKGSVRSPFTFEIDFEPFGGASMSSIQIWYVKNPAAPLTERVSQYFLPDKSNPDRLLFKGAEAPPGHHKIRIEMKDTAGRTNIREFEFDVSD